MYEKQWRNTWRSSHNGEDLEKPYSMICHMVITIKERDLSNMKVNELQCILDTHEQRLNERSAKSEKTSEVALVSQSRNEGNKNKRGKGKWK